MTFSPFIFPLSCGPAIPVKSCLLSHTTTANSSLLGFSDRGSFLCCKCSSYFYLSPPRSQFGFEFRISNLLLASQTIIAIVEDPPPRVRTSKFPISGYIFKLDFYLFTLSHS